MVMRNLIWRVGQRVEVLVEGAHEDSDLLLRGRLATQAPDIDGGVIINDIPTYRIDHMPYGGVKDSGLGREGLRWAIDDMTEIRIMVLAQPG